MNIITNGAFGSPATATPAPGFPGAAAWRVRQMHGAESVSSLLVTDVPVAKPIAVSALSCSERCP